VLVIAKPKASGNFHLRRFQQCLAEGDVVKDPDGVLRRHLIAMNQDHISLYCALRLQRRIPPVLEAEGILAYRLANL